jgi:hypothetical protein
LTCFLSLCLFEEYKFGATEMTHYLMFLGRFATLPDIIEISFL